MKQFLLLALFILISYFSFAQCSITVDKINICKGDALAFALSTSKTITSTSWDFDNGQTSTSVSPLGSFQTSGIFDVSCTVSFSDGSTCQASKSINVHDFPDALIEIGPETNYCRDVNSICLNDISTTGAGNNITKRHFFWGDGTSDLNQTSASLCHHYTITNKSMELGIETFDSYGCSDTAFLTIDFDPIVSTNLSLKTISETCTNGSYCVELQNSPTTIVKTVQWKLNGASVNLLNKDCFSKDKNFNHLYEVTVTNDFGCISYDSLSLGRAFEDPSGPASFIEDTICYGYQLDYVLKHPLVTNDSFNLRVTAPNNFDILIDSVIYPLPNSIYTPFTYVPKTVGKFTYHIQSLNPIREDCRLDQKVYAWVRGPLAIPSIQNGSQCVPRDTVFFSDASKYFLNSSAIGYHWNLGDPYAANLDYNPISPYKFYGYSTSKDTKHFYQKIGCFPTSLTVVDSITGCVSSFHATVTTSSIGKFNLRVIDQKPLYCEKDTIQFIINLVGHNYQEINPQHMATTICPKGPFINSEKTWFGPIGRSNSGIPEYGIRTNRYCEQESLALNSDDSRNYYYANGSNIPTYISDTVCHTETKYEDLITVDNNPQVRVKLVKSSPIGCEKIDVELKIQTLDSVRAIKLKWTKTDSIVYDFSELTVWDSVLRMELDTGSYKMKVTFYSKCMCETEASVLITGGLRVKPIINAICGGSHFDLDYSADYIGEGWDFRGDTMAESYSWQFDTMGWTRNMDTLVPYDTTGPYGLYLAYSDSSGLCVDTIYQLVPVKKVKADFSSSHDKNYCKKLIEFYDESIVLDSGTITQYDWDLFDGTKSDFKNPSKLFKLKGEYSIRLIATSLEGCKDTFSRVIELDGPDPNFAFITDTIGCHPLNIGVVNRSTKAKSFIWEWNDHKGSISDSKIGGDSILYFDYTKPGTYKPILRAFDTVYTRDNYYVCSEFYPDPDYGHSELIVEVLDSINLNFKIEDVACTGQYLDLSNTTTYDHLDYFYYLSDTNSTFSWANNRQYLVNEKGGSIHLTFFARSKPDSDLPNCSDTFRYQIPIQNPIVDFDYCISATDQSWRTVKILNESNDIRRYLWTSIGDIQNDNARETKIKFPESFSSSEVCLTGWSKAGCEVDTCVDILLPRLELFNVFTPNMDSDNASFDLITEHLEYYNLKIYNRYGELVFKSLTDGIGNSSYNWNGRYMGLGNPLPEGTYFYVFKYKINNCKEQMLIEEGIVDLIR
ncbi:MAG: hypothetical protein COA58_14020 [Bacteroidetes bacterium]|nr:MAG: hypothetical protein COA58_14020 [Bacteroidota bacterium]